MNCFSGTTTAVLKAPHYFYCFLKITFKKPTFLFHNILIGNEHAVSLGRCGQLQVMFCSLFILDSISIFRMMVFYCVLLVIEAPTV